MFTILDLEPIIAGFKHEIIGDKNLIRFDNAKTLQDQDSNSIIWLKKPEQDVRTFNSNMIIYDSKYPFPLRRDEQILIAVNNPKFVFSRIINLLFVEQKTPQIGKNTCIDSDCEIGLDVYIGNNVSIGKCKIGNNVVLHDNCTIYDNTIIGNNTIVHSGTVIGTPGFGYSRNENNEIEHFPHIGGVLIEDYVEIGANVCIDRGALGNTIIQYGCKIDNLVHIAHNVVIGKNSFIIANSMIGGSTIIGENCWIAPSVSILQQLTIGNNATIGTGAVVSKSVPDGETWAGIPARPIDEFKLLQKKLREL